MAVETGWLMVVEAGGDTACEYFGFGAVVSMRGNASTPFGFARISRFSAFPLAKWVSQEE
jgi:hypothetical protein